VSIVSMLHLAWLAVIIPLGIAAAGYATYALAGRRSRRATLHRRGRDGKSSARIAA